MNISIGRLNFINILSTVIVFGLVVGFFVVDKTMSSYEKRVVQLENEYKEQNKELVKTEVNRVVKRIEYTRKAVYERLSDSLKDKTDYIANILGKTGAVKTDKKAAIEEVKSDISAFTWNGNTGYIYIVDRDGTILYHPKKEYVGKNILIAPTTGKALKSFMNEAFLKGENFGRYDWPKPEQNFPKPKYVYIKHYKTLGIYIGAGVYADEADKDIQKIILEQLERERFGYNQYGYFWVHDLSSTMLRHPIVKKLDGTNVSNLKTSDGQFLFKNMNDLVLKQGEGFIEYSWARPDNGSDDKKISYIHLIKEWNWVVGSGFYLSELAQMIAEEKKSAQETMYSWIEGISLILSALILFSILAATYISRRIAIIERNRLQYANQLEQYKSILDKTAVVSKTDLTGKINYVNDKFCEVSEYKAEEVIGRAHRIVGHPQTPKETFNDMWNTIKVGGVWHGLIKNRSKSGKSYYNDTTIVPLKNEDGNIVEYISSGVDVTELVENREKLDNAFMTDILTGLGSRMKLLGLITDEQDSTLALIDIASFREINDLKGQKFGDAIIAECARRIFAHFADYDYELFRIHADVFGVFAKGDSLEALKQNVKSFMELDQKNKYEVFGESLTVRYNVGLAMGQGEIIAWADIALKDAKNLQDTSIAVFEKDANTLGKYKDNLEWVDRLSEALEADNLVAYFQPIYNYKTEKVDKYECLVRIVSEDNIYTPDRFLDVAKKTKLYSKLTRRMIEKSIEKFSKNTYEFSINLCIEDLLQRDLMDFLFEHAIEKEVMKRMVLEIVESEEMQNYEDVIGTITRFKEAGARIAIDDFGSGYSNFDYLISLKADYIKIDGSIVKNITKDARVKELIIQIVNFAKTYDMKTIAEFVANEDIDREIRTLSIDYAQGYFYGKPSDLLL